MRGSGGGDAPFVTPVSGPRTVRRMVSAAGVPVFVIDGAEYAEALIVTAAGVQIWQPPAFENISADDFSAFSGGDVRYILLGTGTSFRALPPAVRLALRDQGLTVEAMDTQAACRTFNVLLTEGRAVAVALLPPSA